jgi:hypothetical protein
MIGFDQGALAERLVTDLVSHVYFPSELELLFLSAGFEIVQQYGDYRFTRGPPRRSLAGFADQPNSRVRYEQARSMPSGHAGSRRLARKAPARIRRIGLFRTPTSTSASRVVVVCPSPSRDSVVRRISRVDPKPIRQ